MPSSLLCPTPATATSATQPKHGHVGTGASQPVLFLVVTPEHSNSRHSQLNAPKCYRKLREVGIRPGGFIVFFQACK